MTDRSARDHPEGGSVRRTVTDKIPPTLASSLPCPRHRHLPSHPRSVSKRRGCPAESTSAPRAPPSARYGVGSEDHRSPPGYFSAPADSQTIAMSATFVTSGRSSRPKLVESFHLSFWSL